MSISKGSRRGANMTRELQMELADALKADGVCHLRDAMFLPSQQLTCCRDTVASNVSMRTEAGSLPEQSREVIDAETREFGEFAQGDSAFGALVNAIEYSVQSYSIEPAARRCDATSYRAMLTQQMDGQELRGGF
jgi:hypothetical protein